jgi:chromosome segregation ATPase
MSIEERDKARKEKEESETEINKLQTSITDLKKQLSEAQDAGNDEEVEQLQTSLEETETELETSKKRIEELECELKEIPIAVPATTTVEVVPEDIQKELDELREKNKQLEAKAGQSPTIKKFEVCFETLTTSFSNLLGALGAVKASDEAEYDKYKNAVNKLIVIMIERLV